MKKALKLFVSLTLAFALCACSTAKEENKTPTEEVIQIHFTIIDASQSEDEVLFDEAVVVSANCETLADVINEAKDELNAVTEDGAYGMQIMGLMGKECNWDKGPWWLYDSENNDSCVNAGYCDGASNLVVEDGDSFTFRLTSEY